MKAPHRRDANDNEPGMTSMIDVVFLLLVFFVWTSSFDEPERNIASQIAMPAKAAQAIAMDDGSAPPESTLDDQEPRREEVVVRILAGADGLRYQIGAVEAATLSELLSKLQRIASLPTSPLLIVDPDDSVDFEDCIEVYDHAIGFGFPRVLFAVD